MPPLPVTAIGILLVCWATTTSAHAYEDRLTLGPELGVAAAVGTDNALPCCGPLVGVAGSLGLDDVFTLRSHLGYALHPADEPLHVGIFGVEVLYLVDIVEVVPFFGAGLDALASLQGSEPTLEAAVHVVMGLDYLLSRETLIGVDLRLHYLPLSFDERIEPVYLTINARYSWSLEL